VPTGILAALPLPAAVALDGGPVPSVAVSARLHAVAEAHGRTLEHQGPQERAVLAVTDPRPCTDPSGRRYTPLPGAVSEGEFLAEAFGADHRSGDEATKATVAELLSRRWWAVHLGAHGMIDPVAPRQSRLLLRDGPDGMAEALSVGELAGSIGGARVVFLACCWLAQAGWRLPDEAIGFPTVLLEQGTGAVIAPLWPVEDKACQALVETFYEGWLKGGLSPAGALAEAQAGSRAEHPNSSCWAAFVLAGG
jgi:CHAT domain-containing protein